MVSEGMSILGVRSGFTFLVVFIWSIWLLLVDLLGIGSHSTRLMLVARVT